MAHEAKIAEINALKQKLCSFPQGLYDARIAHAHAQERVKTLKAECAEAVTEELLMASLAKGADNKPLYSNEATRKAAVEKALSESPTHRDRMKRLSDAETEAMNAEIALRRIEDEHKAWRAVADVTIAEVQLLCAGR